MTDDKVYRTWKSQYPKKTARLKYLDETIDYFIIGDYAPPAPFLDPDCTVLSIGSCFANEVSKSLIAHGVKVATSFIGEGHSSAFALNHLFKHLVHRTPFPEGYLQDEDLFKSLDAGLGEHIRTAQLLVLTFGLSCVWVNRATGKPALEPSKFFTDIGIFKALDTFEMRQTSVEENEAVIVDTINLVRSVNPTSTIVLTLSPVPLVAALTEDPPVAANTVSKAVLRAALHNVCQRKLAGVRYWPSYEYVTWYGSNVEIVLGKDGNDLRHINQSLIDAVTGRFRKYYFKDATAKGETGQTAAVQQA